jgi:hypothetical protein
VGSPLSIEEKEEYALALAASAAATRPWQPLTLGTALWILETNGLSADAAGTVVDFGLVSGLLVEERRDRETVLLPGPRAISRR